MKQERGRSSALDRCSRSPPPTVLKLKIALVSLKLTMTKVGFISLGCPKNLVDSEVMMGLLARDGYELTARADDAEILVVNTCSFIESAQKESIDTILEMAEYKKFGRAQKTDRGRLHGRALSRTRFASRFPKSTRSSAQAKSRGSGGVRRRFRATAAAKPPTYLYHDLSPRILTTPQAHRLHQDQEGCDHPCTFCVIPQLRGNFAAGGSNRWCARRKIWPPRVRAKYR